MLLENGDFASNISHASEEREGSGLWLVPGSRPLRRARSFGFGLGFGLGVVGARAALLLCFLFGAGLRALFFFLGGSGSSHWTRTRSPLFSLSTHSRTHWRGQARVWNAFAVECRLGLTWWRGSCSLGDAGSVFSIGFRTLMALSSFCAFLSLALAARRSAAACELFTSFTQRFELGRGARALGFADFSIDSVEISTSVGSLLVP